MLRISLIIAIIAGLAVGVLNFVMVKEKIETVEKHRAAEQAVKESTQKELSSTKKDLEKTVADLKLTKENLASTEAQRDKAQAEVATLTKKSADLTDKLAKAVEDRNTAQGELAAYKATGLSPVQILSFDKNIKQLQASLEGAKEEAVFLARELTKAKAALAVILEPEYKVPLPPELRGKVVASDPKWDFVVLNIGEDQGVLENGEMLVNRNGKLVAKVRVRTVEKARCIANVVAGWSLGEVLEGDQVFPAL